MRVPSSTATLLHPHASCSPLKVTAAEAALAEATAARARATAQAQALRDDLAAQQVELSAARQEVQQLEGELQEANAGVKGILAAENVSVAEVIQLIVLSVSCVLVGFDIIGTWDTGLGVGRYCAV